MQQNQNSENKVGNNFVEFISIAVKYRKFLFIFIIGVTLIVTLYALIAPKWYKSSASVFPAEQADLLGGLGGLSSLVKGFSSSSGLASLTGNTETDRYIAILKSATVFDRIIKKFDLRSIYDLEDTYYEKVVKELDSNCDFNVEDEGQLSITVYDKDPQRAADIANYFVELLNEINTIMHVQNAKANREFIENRHNKNLQDIAELEDSMKFFQQQYGVVAVPEQLETTVAAMSAIYGQLVEKEIEYSVMETTLGKNHPTVSLTKTEITELKKRINQLNTDGFDDGEINFLIPFKQAPKLAQEYIKIYRDLEIQYTILEFITPLYEQAKVEEVRNTPAVVVLDKAGPAERKAKPKASIYGIISLILTTFISLIIIFSLELYEKLRKENNDRFNNVVKTLRTDLSKLPFFKGRQ